jgi:hypothetical protein
VKLYAARASCQNGSAVPRERRHRRRAEHFLRIRWEEAPAVSERDLRQRFVDALRGLERERSRTCAGVRTPIALDFLGKCSPLWKSQQRNAERFSHFPVRTIENGKVELMAVLAIRHRGRIEADAGLRVVSSPS